VVGTFLVVEMMLHIMLAGCLRALISDPSYELDALLSFDSNAISLALHLACEDGHTHGPTTPTPTNRQPSTSTAEANSSPIQRPSQ
jgi:hypothetical protein